MFINFALKWAVNKTYAVDIWHFALWIKSQCKTNVATLDRNQFVGDGWERLINSFFLEKNNRLNANFINIEISKTHDKQFGVFLHANDEMDREFFKN